MDVNEIVSKADLINLENRLIKRIKEIWCQNPYAVQKYLITKQVSKMLNISSRTLQSYRDRGMIPFTQIGKKIIYDYDDVVEFVNQHKC